MAGSIPEEVVEQVRNSVDIVDVVSRHVQLKKMGKNLFGICPFHEERTPSFSVSEDKQIFHCFSCGRGGNVFRFLMDLENLSFPESVQKVAEFANMQLDQSYFSKSQVEQYSSQQSEQIALYKEAATLYTHILKNTKLGEDALNYLNERGITEDDINIFQIGFAPSDNLLLEYCKEHNIDYEQMRKSGLFVEDDDGDLHDRFFNRIMFPIKNQLGNVVAFSGRVLEKKENQPKYLNSPESEIFNKGRTLYNFDRVRSLISQKRSIILFEGFMDVIAANRAGTTNGIASMGTSLTTDQVTMIARVSKEVVICYDGDDAGQNAIARAIQLVEQESSLKIRIVFLPDGQDPDEYVKNNGSKSFEQLMASSGESSTAFYLKYDRRGLNLTNENDQVAYIRQSIARISRLGDSIEQDIYLKQLSDEFSIDIGDLKQQMNHVYADQTIRQNNRNRRSTPVSEGETRLTNAVSTPTKSLSKVERAERLLLYRALNEHDVWIKLQGTPEFFFPDTNFQTVYVLAGDYLNAHAEYDAASFIDYLKKPEFQRVVADLETINVSDLSSGTEVDDYIRVIKDDAPLSSQIKAATDDLNEAVRLGNQKLQEELTIRLVTLFQQQKVQNRGGN